MRKITVVFLLISSVMLYAFVNAGKWIDVTQKPVKSDIVVCLGGGTIERVKKTIELLEKKYVKSGVFLLIGESNYNQPYINENHPNLNVLIDEKPTNTVEEVFAIEKFMIKNAYRSVLIVTDPTHSKRVEILLSNVFANKNMSFRIVSSNVKWWDSELYYATPKGRSAVAYETFAIVYCYIRYIMFDNYMENT